MTSTPRDVLIEIVAKYGEPLLASPLRTEGLLKDYCGEFRRECWDWDFVRSISTLPRKVPDLSD